MCYCIYSGRYISKYLKIMGRNNPQEKDYRKVFVEKYLRLDGVLVLWLISKNVTDLTIGKYNQQSP